MKKIIMIVIIMFYCFITQYCMLGFLSIHLLHDNNVLVAKY